MILNSPLHKISHKIPSQFPSLYREEASDMIDVVRAYYEFVESTPTYGVNQSRKMLDTIDVDRTSRQMLVFFQKTYMPDLVIDESNVRFVIKNIVDLYRRKGSEDGIHLFFKMFYDADVEVYYPSQDVLKPSWSTWKVGNYIQLYPNSDPLFFSDLPGKKLYGSVTKAEAFVDGVQFINVYGSTIPIIFLDRVRGEFAGLETVYTSSPERKNYGKIYGSLKDVKSVVGVTSDNRVGDTVEVHGDRGFGGKAVITQVSDDISGEVTFEIIDGDFGYTVSSNTELILSDQTLILDNTDLVFKTEERVRQDRGGWVYGTVIGQSITALGLKLDDPDDDSTWFVIGDIETVDRDENITVSVAFAVDAQPSAKKASAKVTEITNQIDVDVVTDVIGDFLLVELNNPNYNNPPALQPMSGSADPIDIDTRILDAFGPQRLTIGTISKLGEIGVGLEYASDAFVLAVENRVSRFDIRDQVIVYDRVATALNLMIGDIIVQERQVLNFAGDTVTSEARGKIVAVEDDAIYVKLRSFYEFIIPVESSNPSEYVAPIYKVGTSAAISVVPIQRDQSSAPMGYNADITALADFEIGRIESVRVVDSGFAYQDGEPVWLHNITRTDDRFADGEPVKDALASIGTRGQGKGEGRWLSKSSHLNFADGKRIHDSDFYQDFSYEIATSISPSSFESRLRDVAHPAGVKLFTKFSLLESINITTSITSEITQADI